MNNRNLFLNKNIIFTQHWKSINLADIEEIIPNNFLGRQDFIDFYLLNNGGLFHHGAFFYRDVFYKIENDLYLPIEISSFYYMPKIGDKEKSEYLTSIIEANTDRHGFSDFIDDILDFDVIFATNFSGNDFCIDGQTGEIKYIDYHDENAIIIAPSFKEFCEHIQPKRRINL
ncbi:Uncharacterised protein [Moraxella lacunata]|uniref:Knr4/Smi1-like domain-containing protein n=1 Tax=Moraxella lacunata TaxID=477 RepID=A0A378TTW4_MORLA|nr:SMI1/KNR4 family protein [Moraxella lacunata]STZ64206.1 Uncharacterised protein [Moraxella lacunata]